ncbi:golgi family complex component [Ophiostoma piceae UAMH 11346]|uniref:Golgi family complex component n=1 Tax=Ophiostoma piceae (strain UAMH 11346) TaxID=1262450 RepID=S3D9A5_OPHP1|nr:golgi family complex component [Ophiostoma piceae UAMH 11346]
MSFSLTERADDGRRSRNNSSSGSSRANDAVIMDSADEDIIELPEPGLQATDADDNDNDDTKTIRGADETDDLDNGAESSTGTGRITINTDTGSELGNTEDVSDGDRTDSPSTPVVQGENGSALRNRYRELLEEQQHNDSASEDGSALGLPRRPGSPGGDSFVSVPDSAASNRHSMISSFGGSSVFPSSGSLSRFGLRGASPSFRPFDQRFQSRIASPSGSTGGFANSGLLSPTQRPSSPALHAFNASGAHHRSSSSLSSQYPHGDASSAMGSGTDTPSPPWEVVRWTKLTKLSGQSFSESAKRNFGSPTCMAISASIVLGTTKGILLVFDYNQHLKLIIGPGTKAVEAGAITSVAISADHTTVAGGHADGSIFTWDLARVSRPFLYVPPMDDTQAQSPNRTVDGHMPGFAVTHLGFLGTRRTALVSADDRGMAFAHLATRGTGALGRSVKTNRILGRYPGTKLPASGKAIKPSTVLAFAPLPLGNVDRATDTMGLTAMLTPYLLVIVSTTPVANTQHKTPRPKEVAPHSAMSGCLAWFPAVKLKVPDPRTGDSISRAKLVYCWSNVLTVLDIEEVPSEVSDKPPTLQCKARSRWKCEEAIVAVQWLTRSVLAVLTISQRLIVLEDHSMRVTEAFDLINRYIYHADLFSRQLQIVVETLDEDDTSLHGVVADAFYMSFKAYKGRLFLLGFNDMAIGALSNWADRLIALMEHGDYVGAIQLATSFYTGDADKLTIGLPEDTKTRHTMVQERLMEIMAASLKYAFSQRLKSRTVASDDHLLELAQTCFIACDSVNDTDFLFDEMYEWFEETGTEGIFLETLEPYILDQTVTAVPPTVVKAMVRHYVGRGLESRLEEIICHMNTATLDLDQITSLCKQHGLYDALVYVWNQAMSDFITPLIDLLSLLVPHMPNGEYEPPENAGGEQDMHDTNALKIFPYLSYVLTGRIYPTGDTMDESTQQQAKSEIFWFLFSGKSVVWPRGSSASKQFLTRPNQSQEPSFPYLRMILKFHAPSFLSALNEAFEDSFLNDSPEKQLVSNGGASMRDLPEEQIFGLTVDRQYIVSILTEIMMNPSADGSSSGNSNRFSPEDTIYLDMFIARNLPKYPQYLLMPESTLTKVLTGLCHYPGEDLEEDAQLSAEYLLSVYHPANMSDLIPLFKDAGFFRILKRTYRTDGQFSKLIQTYFDDPNDRRGVYECIGECLRTQKSQKSAATTESSSNTLRRQIQEVHNVIKNHAFELVDLDPAEAARTLEQYAPELHQHALEVTNGRHDLQYIYLKTILEDTEQHASHPATDAKTAVEERRDLTELYIRLMCEFDPAHVSEYVAVIPSANLRLDEILPTMEDTGVIDAAVILMAQDGQLQKAMDRLVEHLHALESGVQGLLSEAEKDRSEKHGTSSGDTGEETSSVSGDSDIRSNVTIVQRNGAEDLMRALQKYTHVGIWLCQQADRTSRHRQTSRHASKQQQLSNKVSDGLGDKDDEEDHLSADEKLWLGLIDTTVKITRNLSSHIHNQDNGPIADTNDVADAESDKLVALLRSLVQHTFTALLTTTTSTTSAVASTPGHKFGADSRNSSRRSSVVPGAGSNLSFLRILKAFLARAAVSSPNLADLRSVLASIFAAYAYEESILRLSNRLLERSLFVNVHRSVELRQRGWRAKGSTCEACGRRVWGPGVVQQGQGQASQGSGSIYEAWETKQAADAERRSEKKRVALVASRGVLDRGKGKEGESSGVGQLGSSASSSSLLTPGKGKDTLVPPTDGAMSAGRRTPSPRPVLAGRGGELTVGANGNNPLPPGQPAALSLGPLVLFACRHIYHQTCLDALEAARAKTGENGSSASGSSGVDGKGMLMQHHRRQHGVRDRDYVCPIDG